MIVVADTAPLNYLVQLDVIDILPTLYRELVVPHEVVQELRAHMRRQASRYSRRTCPRGLL